MIGIMTAAGKGTRMKALTGKDIPKVLLEINNKPIISYGIESMEEMGIQKIYIVANEKYKDEFDNKLMNYKSVEMIYIGDTNHIMDSVDMLGKFVLKENIDENENYVYWLADNIFVGDDHKNSIRKLDESIDNSKETTGFITIETKQPQDFITMNKNGEWSEKPKNPETNISATGVFVINKAALSDTSRRKMNAGQNEYTIWDSWMSSHKIIDIGTSDIWIDVGTPERYLEIKNSLE